MRTVSFREGISSTTRLQQKYTTNTIFLEAALGIPCTMICDRIAKDWPLELSVAASPSKNPNDWNWWNRKSRSKKDVGILRPRIFLWICVLNWFMPLSSFFVNGTSILYCFALQGFMFFCLWTTYQYYSMYEARPCYPLFTWNRLFFTLKWSCETTNFSGTKNSPWRFVLFVWENCNQHMKLERLLILLSLNMFYSPRAPPFLKKTKPFNPFKIPTYLHDAFAFHLNF